MNSRPSISYLDIKRFKRAFIAGFDYLKENYKVVNKINYFPVPDGDTGTNMFLTINDSVKTLTKKDPKTLKEFHSGIADSIILNAKGNSGIIFSKFLHTFIENISGKSRLYTEDIARAIIKASNKAEKIIDEPVEGTILTIMKEGADECKKFLKKGDGDIVSFLDAVYQRILAALKNTALINPYLSKRKTIDAGALGFCLYFEGIIKLIKGQEFIEKSLDLVSAGGLGEGINEDAPDKSYCVEFILEDAPGKGAALKKGLLKYGNSVVVSPEGRFTKVHFHSDHPLDYFEKYGYKYRVSRLKIENMKNQYTLLAREGGLLPFFIMSNMNFSLLRLAEQILPVSLIDPPILSSFLGKIEERVQVFLIPSSRADRKLFNKFKGPGIFVLPSDSVASALNCMLVYDFEKSPAENYEALDGSPSSFRVITVKSHYGSFLFSFRGRRIAGKSVYGPLESIIKKAGGPSDYITVYAGGGLSAGESKKLARGLKKAFGLEPEIISTLQDETLMELVF